MGRLPLWILLGEGKKEASMPDHGEKKQEKKKGEEGSSQSRFFGTCLRGFWEKNRERGRKRDRIELTSFHFQLRAGGREIVNAATLLIGRAGKGEKEKKERRESLFPHLPKSR